MLINFCTIMYFIIHEHIKYNTGCSWITVKCLFQQYACFGNKWTEYNVDGWLPLMHDLWHGFCVALLCHCLLRKCFREHFEHFFSNKKCSREHHYALSQHRKQETSACPTSFCDQGPRDKGIQSSAILFPAHILMSSNLSLNL